MAPESKKQFYINGNWVNPLQGKDFEVINPSNEEVCAIISLGGQADTDNACLLYTSPSPRDRG